MATQKSSIVQSMMNTGKWGRTRMRVVWWIKAAGKALGKTLVFPTTAALEKIAYFPTNEELEELFKYWGDVELRLAYLQFIMGELSMSDNEWLTLARQRMDLAIHLSDDQDEIFALLDEVTEKVEKLADADYWHTFIHGDQVEWDARSDDTWSTIYSRAWPSNMLMNR